NTATHHSAEFSAAGNVVLADKTVRDVHRAVGEVRNGTATPILVINHGHSCDVVGDETVDDVDGAVRSVGNGAARAALHAGDIAADFAVCDSHSGVACISDGAAHTDPERSPARNLYFGKGHLGRHQHGEHAV